MQHRVDAVVRQHLVHQLASEREVPPGGTVVEHVVPVDGPEVRLDLLGRILRCEKRVGEARDTATGHDLDLGGAPEEVVTHPAPTLVYTIGDPGPTQSIGDTGSLPLGGLLGIVTGQAIKVGEAVKPWVERQLAEPLEGDDGEAVRPHVELVPGRYPGPIRSGLR